MKIGKICAKHPELLGKRYNKGDCCGCVKDQGRAYRETNAEAIAERRRQSYLENADKVRGRVAAYQKANAAKISDRRKAAYAADRTRVREYQRRMRELDPVKTRERQKAYNLAADKAVKQAAVARRRASKLQATPAWANKFFIQEAYALAKLRERICGGKWQVDHIVPLRSKLVCGLHVEHNLQVIPAAVNHAKRNYYWPNMP